MKVVANREPRIVEHNGRRGRMWTGRSDSGHVCHVTIYETGGAHIEIEVEEVEIPTLEEETP